MTIIYFRAYMSAESPSNISPNPSEVLSENVIVRRVQRVFPNKQVFNREISFLRDFLTIALF
jgi:hypothetical protein